MVNAINDGDQSATDAMIEEWKAYKRAQGDAEPES
jgi:hypothetical protein